MKLEYRSDSDQFYHNTIHIENGYLVATDGNWLRIFKDTVIQPTTDLEIVGEYGYIKPSNPMWRFPPVWKHIVELEVLDDQIHKDRMIARLYKADIVVDFDYLYRLDNVLLKYRVLHNQKLLVIDQDYGLRTVVPYTLLTDQ